MASLSPRQASATRSQHAEQNGSRADQGEGGGFGNTGALFVEDGSFAKLRELSIAYTLTANFLHALGGFTSADIRLAGRNLKTWTKYKGLDPEANLGGAEYLTQGIDYFNHPQARSFVLAFSLNR